MITPPSTGSWSLSGATLLGLDFVSVKRDPITAIELKSCACNINGNWETTKTDLLLRQIDEFAFLFQRTHWTTWLRGKAPTCCGVRCLWKLSSNLNYCYSVSCLLSCSQPILCCQQRHRAVWLHKLDFHRWGVRSGWPPMGHQSLGIRRMRFDPHLRWSALQNLNLQVSTKMGQLNVAAPAFVPNVNAPAFTPSWLPAADPVPQPAAPAPVQAEPAPMQVWAQTPKLLVELTGSGRPPCTKGWEAGGGGGGGELGGQGWHEQCCHNPWWRGELHGGWLWWELSFKSINNCNH